MGVATWGDAEIESLRTLWAKGLTATQIAWHLGGQFSRSAVCGKAHRLRLPERDTTKRPAQPRLAPGKGPKRPKPNELAATEAKDIAHLDNEPAPMGPVGDFPAGNGCRWPHGVGQTFQCCGHPNDGSSPYCSHHRARAWIKPMSVRIKVPR
jgi:hypothetical protein